MTLPNPRILIAEDEAPMRERLLSQLAQCWPEAEVVAVAENGYDAWDAYLAHEPDVVFLDIRMPGLSGLQVASKIRDGCHIVFVTAYDQYTLDAFDAGAHDYLLKPIEIDRLQRCIARLQSKLVQAPADISGLLAQLKTAIAPTQSERLKWIKASVGKQIKLIKVEDVLFFQSDTKYTRVVMSEGEALIRTPLKDLLDGLDPELFWQIHRSTLVNVNAISACERIDAERMQVLLKTCSEKLTVSRAFTHLFRD